MQFISSLGDFFQYDFLILALVGTIILSFTCGLVSPLIVARKYAFMGAAVSHSSLLGIAVALSIVNADQYFLIFFVTLLVTLIFVSLLAWASFKQKLPSDSLIGVFFTTTMSLGILIYHLFHQGKGDLLGYLFGNILLLTNTDLIIAIIVLAITAPLILIPIKKWIYFSFDEQAAYVSGLPTNIYHFGFFFLITLIIVSAIKIAGTVLVNTLLIIPGIVGLKFAPDVYRTFHYSVIFSLITALGGLVLANYLNTPSGATLAVVQFATFMLFLFSKKLLKC